MINGLAGRQPRPRPQREPAQRAAHRLQRDDGDDRLPRAAARADDRAARPDRGNLRRGLRERRRGAAADARRFARKILPGVREMPAHDRRGRALARPGDAAASARRSSAACSTDFTPAHAEPRALRPRVDRRWLRKIDDFNRCITDVIIPTGNIKVDDGEFSAKTENYKEFWHAMVGPGRRGRRASTATGPSCGCRRRAAARPIDDRQDELLSSSRCTPMRRLPPLRTSPAFPNKLPPLQPRGALLHATRCRTSTARARSARPTARVPTRRRLRFPRPAPAHSRRADRLRACSRSPASREVPSEEGVRQGLHEQHQGRRRAGRPDRARLRGRRLHPVQPAAQPAGLGAGHGRGHLRAQRRARVGAGHPAGPGPGGERLRRARSATSPASTSRTARRSPRLRHRGPLRARLPERDDPAAARRPVSRTWSPSSIPGSPSRATRSRAARRSRTTRPTPTSTSTSSSPSLDGDTQRLPEAARGRRRARARQGRRT